MPISNNKSTIIYTDGSCHTQLKTGTWAAIIFINAEKITLTGNAINTTHHRMELTAVIRALEYVKKAGDFVNVKLVSDSQYVTGLIGRKEKLSAAAFKTKKGKYLQNVDLVIELLNLNDTLNIEWIKIKAHQKENEEANYNIEADKLSRALLRETVRQMRHVQENEL